MMNYISMLTSGMPRRVRRLARSGLVFGAVLTLSAGMAWAQTPGSTGPLSASSASLFTNALNFLQTVFQGIVQAFTPTTNSAGSTAYHAPEIDPTVAVSAIAIVAAGILLVGDRVRRIKRNREG